MNKRNTAFILASLIFLVFLGFFIWDGLHNGQSRMTVTIRNQKDLENYLKQTGKDWAFDEVYFENQSSLSFPKRTYQVTGNVNWYFSSKAKGDIDFAGSKVLIGQRAYFEWKFSGDHLKKEGTPCQLKDLSVYGSVKEKTDLESGQIKEPHPNGGRFNAQLFHTSNLYFTSLNFYNAQQSSNHLFDLVGSENLSFTDMTFAGYGGETYSDQALKARYAKDWHTIYAEAIQIDSAIPGSLGDKLDLKATVLWTKDTYDGRPSSNISVDASQFIPYQGPTGQSLISGKKEEVEVNYGPSIGAHTVGNQDYSNISLTNNRFVRTISVPGEDNAILYPIHFHHLKNSQMEDFYNRQGLTIRGNQFEQEASYPDWRNGKISAEDEFFGWFK